MGAVVQEVGTGSVKTKELTRQKVAAVLRKAGLPTSKTHSTRVRGWTNSTEGVNVTGGPRYATTPSGWVTVDDPITVGFHAGHWDRGDAAKAKVAGFIARATEALRAAGIACEPKMGGYSSEPIGLTVTGWAEVAP